MSWGQPSESLGYEKLKGLRPDGSRVDQRGQSGGEGEGRDEVKCVMKDEVGEFDKSKKDLKKT